MTLSREYIIDHRAWTQGNPKVREPRKSDIGADELETDRAGSDRVLAGTPIEEDDMQIADLNDAAAKGQLGPFLDAIAGRAMTFVRDKAGLATAAQISSAVTQLAGRISDTRSAVLEFLGTQPTDGLSEDERRQLVADIVAGVDALSEDDADAVAEKLAERPLVFGPAPAA